MSDSEEEIGPSIPHDIEEEREEKREEREEESNYNNKRTNIEISNDVNKTVDIINNTDINNTDINNTDINHHNHKKKKLLFDYELLYLSKLPSHELYESSYMHKDTILLTHVTKTDFMITTSVDGMVKFWKKGKKGVEFVKIFKAANGPVNIVASSMDGMLLGTGSTEDKNIKIYDIINFDMILQLELTYLPYTLCWIHPINTSKGILAISSQEDNFIYLYKPLVSATPFAKVDLHDAKYNPVYNCVLSVDINGDIEYWDVDTYDLPKVEFKYKAETSLYEFSKDKIYINSIEISLNGQYFVTSSRDSKIRVFKFSTGKIIKVYDNSYKEYEEAQNMEGSIFKIDPIDFGRRIALENDIFRLTDPKNTANFQNSNAIFDESSNFIISSSMMGIKMVNIHTNKMVRLLGKSENSQRFMHLALFQGKSKNLSESVAHQLGHTSIAAAQNAIAPIEEDPTLFCTAWKKDRFYMFTKREPSESNGVDTFGRDIYNERPTHDDSKVSSNYSSNRSARTGIIHTTKGDIHIRFYPDECPKTVENFATHARNNYYSDIKIHRVIRGFMIQTGDPKGDGTGGESIFGSDFEDEINRTLKHDRPGTISMANAGPNTNASQFFITTVHCPWLDGKHTVFGRVTKGMDIVQNIESVETDSEDRPLSEIKIVNIHVE